MTSAEIEKAIIETLRELQAGCGEPEQQITPKTLPLVDLGFFDSLLQLKPRWCWRSASSAVARMTPFLLTRRRRRR